MLREELNSNRQKCDGGPGSDEGRNRLERLLGQHRWRSGDLLARDEYDGRELTTITEGNERVQIQNVRRALIERQAASLNLPVHFVHIPRGATNQEYEDKTARALSALRDQGVEAVAFGDLFLADIRRYRECLLTGVGMRACLLVGEREDEGSRRRFMSGFEALPSVRQDALDRTFAGRIIDRSFIDALPPGVDPCGENGEFHTFVFGGPLFARRVLCAPGEVTEADGHYYCDLLPV